MLQLAGASPAPHFAKGKGDVGVGQGREEGRVIENGAPFPTGFILITDQLSLPEFLYFVVY